jgi:tyrosine-protein kinase Etk/Wzc
MLDAANNIVLLTGPTPGIGKSFTSVNFAAVLAAANKKVLLIDADLRKGHLNQYFGLQRGKGFSEVVSGTVTLQDALHPQVLPNVDFLTTGTMPPNPAEVLMTSVNQQMLQRAAEHYDIVIIDTAPVLVASDASILAPLAGAVFLIARADVTSVAELGESVKRLQQTGAQTKGVIFNGLNISQRRYGAGYKYGRYRYINYKY